MKAALFTLLTLSSGLAMADFDIYEANIRAERRMEKELINYIRPCRVAREMYDQNCLKAVQIQILEEKVEILKDSKATIERLAAPRSVARKEAMDIVQAKLTGDSQWLAVFRNRDFYHIEDLKMELKYLFLEKDINRHLKSHRGTLE